MWWCECCPSCSACSSSSDSLGRIQNALELRRCEYPSWKIFLLLAVLSVVLGIVMVVDPFGTMETLVMAIGLILILEGALNLLSALYTMLAVRRFIKLHPETQSMLEAITGQDLNGDGVIAPDVSHADVESTAVELDYVDESAEVVAGEQITLAGLPSPSAPAGRIHLSQRERQKLPGRRLRGQGR